LLERYFKLAENQTTVKREVLGGLTTFLTMAYIVVVNPQFFHKRECPSTVWFSRPALQQRPEPS